MNEEKLKVLKVNVKKAYEKGSPEQKQFIEELWPGEFKPILITYRIKNFKDVLDYLEIGQEEFDNNIVGDTPDETAYKQLKLIARALNELKHGEELDRSKTWYTPYFDRRSGFGFASADYVNWFTITTVGSRLSFKTADLAIYAGKTFTSIYEQFMVSPVINQSN